jgi:hypothetical protein
MKDNSHPTLEHLADAWQHQRERLAPLAPSTDATLARINARHHRSWTLHHAAAACIVIACTAVSNIAFARNYHTAASRQIFTTGQASDKEITDSVVYILQHS